MLFYSYNIAGTVEFPTRYGLISQTTNDNSDVLLTVHLSIFILVINQHDAQNFVLQYVYFMPPPVSSNMCLSSGGQNCIIQPLVSSHL